MKNAPEEVCILAGGLSSRMGRDKSRMRLQGMTLLGHVRKLAAKLDAPVRVIRRDLVPRCGPLGGVYTAFHTSNADSFLFLACDMPFVSASVVQTLVKQFDSRTDAVFARLRRRAGFPFLLRRSLLPRIEKQIALRRFSLQELARLCGAKRISSPSGQSWRLVNINSPEDWESARRLARKQLTVE
jgi:molybdopterin-guanine dinucleotide biosynthesis protein A